MNKSLTAALLLASAFLSQAQTPSPPPSTNATPAPTQARIDVDKERLIRSVLDRTQQVEMVQERLRQAMEGMKQAMPRVPEKYFEKYRTLITVEELRNHLIGVFDKHFSVEELKELLQFYDSPVGKKMTEQSVPILRETMEIAQQMSKRAMDEVTKEFRTEQLLERPRAAAGSLGPPIPPSRQVLRPEPSASPSPSP